MIIIVMGLPGSGKTTLATRLAAELNAKHINADVIRRTVTKHLGFSIEDRLENARVLGELTRAWQGNVVVDFICPTPACLSAFGAHDVLIFMDTIRKSRYPDTDSIFIPPSQPTVRIPTWVEADNLSSDFSHVFNMVRK